MTCPICPRRFRPVLGHGPCPARYGAVGERPGQWEMKQGIPFVGPSGREWNETYLPLAGLSRTEVFVSNTVKCFAMGNRTPNEKEIAGCSAHWLPGELDKVQPEIVFLLGGVACSLVPGLRLETDHGRPFEGSLFGWKGFIVPMYHPALGLHETRWMSVLLDDWKRLQPWLETREWVWPVDQYPETDYRLVHKDGVRTYFEENP